MLLSNQLEQFVYAERMTTVRAIAREFGLSEERCREELFAIQPYGIAITFDGRVFARANE